MKTHSVFGLIGKGAYSYVQNVPVLQWGDWLFMKGKLPALAVQTSLRHASWWPGTTPSEAFLPLGYLHCEDS